MKSIYTQTVHDSATGKSLTLHAWIKSKRKHSKKLFIELIDSKGTVQCVIDKDENPETFAVASKTTLESAVKVSGVVTDLAGDRELLLDSFEVISPSKDFSPQIRSDFDIFDEKFTDHALNNRHLYIRNPKVSAGLMARSDVMGYLHGWFRDGGYTSIDAPILTELPLYEDSTAIPVEVHKQPLYLTQCVGFYLESAVMSFEKCYNLGPSFRAEEGKSKRHLIEYWHIKGEMAWVDREDIMAEVEKLVHDLVVYARENLTELAEQMGTHITTDNVTLPFPRITYPEAIEQLQAGGFDITFGESLSDKEEAYLGRDYDSPFWVVGNPHSIEPFPYCIDRTDERLTMTADLLAPKGFGELCGVAEKITSIDELDGRMVMKNRTPGEHPKYDWVREMREVGFAPHGGFGMGFERVVRWVFQHSHVRDFTAYPRIFGRKSRP